MYAWAGGACCLWLLVDGASAASFGEPFCCGIPPLVSGEPREVPDYLRNPDVLEDPPSDGDELELRMLPWPRFGDALAQQTPALWARNLGGAATDHRSASDQEDSVYSSRALGKRHKFGLLGVGLVGVGAALIVKSEQRVVVPAHCGFFILGRMCFPERTRVETNRTKHGVGSALMIGGVVMSLISWGRWLP